MSAPTARHTPIVYSVLVIGALLLGLPLAVWADLRTLSEVQLTRQAGEMSRIVDAVRGFYSTNVAARIQAAHGEKITTSADYRNIPGAVPIPASFSLELGAIFSNQNGTMNYRFVSDLPFKGRAPHNLDAFETNALERLRRDPKAELRQFDGSLFDRVIRLATPVLMAQPCVDCHNTHPDSPKKDWKVGDVRAIQSISILQAVNGNAGAFKYLLIYLGIIAASGLTFIMVQRRQAREITAANSELATANEFLASISLKIAKYISPQVYKGIFSGQRDVVVATERKKLTIFFSDIQDFTATTEQMQPEDLTAILNEYFTEMSLIAQKHGGTVDKFIGDAVLVFFGDPETKGIPEDARACMAMALEMQARIAQLGEIWRARGIERPFKARMGINTGYCNVGNFGSEDRLDYTIIGAEANLAARLQTSAEPGGIVISYETYAHVRDMVEATEMAPIQMKGISRLIVPFSVTAAAGVGGAVSVHLPGLDLRLDPASLNDEGREAAKRALVQAYASLNQ